MRDILHQAYVALRYNRRRSAMTMLGMAWGIATVVLLLAYGDGFGTAIYNIFKTYGIKVIGVFPGTTSLQSGGSKAGSRVRFVIEDIERLRQAVPQITRITPCMGRELPVNYENRSYRLQIDAEYPSGREIFNQTVAEGIWFNAEHELERAHVAVLGADARKKLFGNRNVLGEYIRIRGIPFEIIGVARPKMQEDGGNFTERVYISWSAMGDLVNTHYVDQIWVMYDVADYIGVENSIRSAMASQYSFRNDDQRAVFIRTAEKDLAEFRIVIIGLKLLLVFIGALTLGIGGVGLMNVMLVAVSQRTREIGMLKALGARRRQVLLQFLAEALTITAAGGVIGILLAYGIAYSFGTITLYSAIAENGEAGDIRLIISPFTVLVSTLILGGVGLASGLGPAIRASRLDPIEALRYE
jgi:putative ABC transport system permease protein